MAKSDCKTALVLGAIKGIGKAIAIELARRGVRLIVTYYDWPESLNAMHADLRAAGADYLAIEINLLQTEDIPGLIQQALRRFGRIDYLINNIERGGWPVVHGPYNQAQWDLEQATTLRAKWWVFTHTLPYLKARPGSAVINFSSIAGIVGRSGPAGYVFNDGYAAASRATSLLTESWARQAAPEARVNEIMLGLIETRHGPNTRGWGLLRPDQRQALRGHTLLGRTGTIDDVVRAVTFLLFDAPFMTGAVLRLDGGYVLGGDCVPDMPAGVV